MAFNPFETFSVRSRTGKAVMAILGIVVMLTFVLSSGTFGSGTDFFDQINGIFSSRGKRGDVVAKAYGDDVRDSEINQIHRQRRAAREFLAHAAAVSYDKVVAELATDVRAGKLAPETKAALDPFLNTRTAKNRQGYSGFLGGFFQFSQDMMKFQQAMSKAKLKP